MQVRIIAHLSLWARSGDINELVLLRGADDTLSGAGAQAATRAPGREGARCRAERAAPRVCPRIWTWTCQRRGPVPRDLDVDSSATGSCAASTQRRVSQSGSCHARQPWAWLPSGLSPAGPGSPARPDGSRPSAPRLVNAASVCYCNFLRPVARFAQRFIDSIQPPGGASGRPANRDTWPSRVPDKGLC